MRGGGALLRLGGGVLRLPRLVLLPRRLVEPLLQLPLAVVLRLAGPLGLLLRAGELRLGPLELALGVLLLALGLLLLRPLLKHLVPNKTQKNA